MTKLVSFAAVLAVAAAAVLPWPGSGSTDLAAFGAAQAQDAQVDTSLVHEMALGAEDAPVTIYEYASATCPHCKNFHLNTFGKVKSEYIDTGKVRLIYREVYFDRFGLWAGMVARCGTPTGEDADPELVAAGEKRYFAIMNLVYEQQATWTQADSPAGVAANLARIGRTAGLSPEQVDACLQDADLARAMVAVYEETSAADGVESTPTFIINGKKAPGNMSFDDFSALIEEAM